MVKRHNLDRSPVFTEVDVGRPKLEAALDFLAGAGSTNIRTEFLPAHEAKTWTARSAGTPDVVISAANEQNARYHIESQYPPVQLYDTTGRNWQMSLIRHIPFRDACSCCQFPDEAPGAPMACASAPSEDGPEVCPQVDAALPFLSFGAGLMTAVEILKLSLPGYPFSRNRVTVTTRPSVRLTASSIPRRQACICGERKESIHRRMMDGGKHVSLTPLHYKLVSHRGPAGCT